MNLKYFIDRPVFSIVISVTIILLGIISLANLPVEQYPDIAPPTVLVTTQYPGASAETVQKSVIVPLEEAINGVENMTYINSTASNNGEAMIFVYFRQGTDPDMAAVNVQNRVATATGLLPTEVVQIGVTTSKQQNSELKTIALYSEDASFDSRFLNNYMKINVEPRIKRVAGVGKFELLGSMYSMRIWMKPDKMAQYKLIPSDITAALQKQNIEAATGAFGENNPNVFQYTMKYRGRFSTPEEFENIVLKSLPDGKILRIKDVADVELGDEAYNYMTEVNGSPAAIAIMYQTPGSNASQIIHEIDEVLHDVEKDLPDGMEFITLTDTNDFLYASINEVIVSLILAIILVVLVVYFFLQDFKATLIPTIAIFVSVIGTFAFMEIAGFSINLLTLFALVLAIGTVVDNAIVVVEAVQAKFDCGYTSAKKATVDAMGGVSAAIFTSTLIFMAVFIPVSMMGGTSGVFYTQFGITMAVAVGISAINAFTLSPALCAILMKPYVDENGNVKNNFSTRFRAAFTTGFTAVTNHYLNGVRFFVKHKFVTGGCLVAGILLLVIFVKNTKTGLVPDEDNGAVYVSLNTVPGTSLHRTAEIMEKMSSYLEQIPEVKYIGAVPGYSFGGASPSYGLYYLTLRHWDERKEKGSSANDVIDKIYRYAEQFPDLQIYAVTPPMIAGYGISNGFELYTQDKVGGDVHKFNEVTQNFIKELNKRPEIAAAYSSFETRYPQYLVEVDAAKCEQSGLSPSDVLSTLSGYYGGAYVSNFNRFSKLYKVMIQADPKSRITPESINHIYIRTGDKMAPLDQFVKLTKTYGPQTMDRFNLYNAITINGSAAKGYSSGDAIRAVEETAEKFLPHNYGYEFAGIAREESESSGNTVTIFVVCILLVYLILSALYESFMLPFAVILAVPCGLMGCFLFAKIFGLENNIYLQTGLVMLIGLLAKTAILITEYATKQRMQGMTLTDAAIDAAKVRLRPILMTALTMIFGMLPMMFSNGVGANGSRSLAAGAVGGMTVGTLVLLFIVPGLFVVFQYLQEKIHPAEKSDNQKD